ncbi:hypothetical protein CEXT_422181 [Caerostris extrusa]|uniref:Uncharacterized protein n=1 Tax=Caerostris extrusa TaxID=172846 RepID=A0AAV4QHE2_CAEEX|nr:hypothetical protein CEXT_422181 [Caerostris extrusa]
MITQAFHYRLSPLSISEIHLRFLLHDPGYKLPETLTAPCSETTPCACRPLNGVPDRKIGGRVHNGKDGLVTRSGHPPNPFSKGVVHVSCLPPLPRELSEWKFH